MLEGNREEQFAPRTALITGAAGGIGAALCDAFSDAGYEVLGTDLKGSQSNCKAFIVEDIRELCDDGERLRLFVDNCAGFLANRGLNVLINSAATQLLNHVEDVSREQWDETLKTNLLAPFFLTKALLPMLMKAKGSIINIASIHAQNTKPRFVAYATSKAALVGLTKAMAVDLGSKARVNAISPAATETPMLKEGFRGHPEKLKELEAHHPLGRIAQPREIAEAALFLASSGAAFISGTVLAVDGGIGGRLHDPD